MYNNSWKSVWALFVDSKSGALTVPLRCLSNTHQVILYIPRSIKKNIEKFYIKFGSIGYECTKSMNDDHFLFIIQIQRICQALQIKNNYLCHDKITFQEELVRPKLNHRNLEES